MTAAADKTSASRTLFDGKLRRATRFLANDTGVAALIVAAVVAVIAFTALSIFLNGYIGDRTFERVKAANKGPGLVLPAVVSSFYAAGPSYTLTCPDQDQDGDADITGNNCNVKSGTLPWTTLGLSRDDVLDSYGNYYAFVVSSVAKNVCFSVGNDYDASAAAEYTGSMISATDLEVRLTSQSAGEGRYVPFVIFSHGKNGYGATSSAGTAQSEPPAANTYEVNNAGSAPTVVYTGPYTDDETNAFDDQVFAPSNAELQKACESLSPGGQLNAEISDNFDSADQTVDTEKFDTTGSGTPPTITTDANSPGNKVASFTNANSFLASNSGFNFYAVVRPVYVAALWTPNPLSAGVTNSGFSIATRATLTDLGAGTDIFSANTASGITFRFDDRDGTTISGAGVPNNLRILEFSGGMTNTLATSAATYNLINAATYLIEAYDDGANVWMRITQTDNIANTAIVTVATSADLTSAENRVLFINGPSQSYLDEAVIGLPMLSLETNGTTGYASSAADTNDFQGAAPYSVTLEAWIRPDAYPSGNNNAAIIARWDTAAAAADQAYRLYLNSSGVIQFQMAGSVSGSPAIESYSTGIKPNLEEWTHVAVTYNATTRVVSFYQDGELAGTSTSSISAATGVNDPTTRLFSVGADFNSGAAADFYDGKISDVRVWQTARTAVEIRNNFQLRLAAAGAVSNLVVNWKFDSESGGLTSTTVSASPSTIGDGGTLTSASYAPALAVYFRPFSTTFCPSGSRVGPYQCDFRVSASAGMAYEDITIPANLPNVFVKAWGAGGGAYDVGADERVGAAGGYSSGRVQSIGGNSVAGLLVDVLVGGYGTGSTTQRFGAGGGGGSGIFAVTPTPGLVAGGGGGASFSTDDVSGGGNCSTATGANQCGLGGGGGGAGGSANTTRAVSEGVNCGGGGGNQAPFGADDGNNAPPDSGTNCPNGGTNPSGQLGGGAGGGGAGGGPTAIAGGNGFAATNSGTRVGGGGGGGGATGGEAGGYDDGANASGYGGGGGSGTADAGVTNVTGAVGATVAATTFSDSTRTGNLSNNSTIITNISPSVATSSWTVGMYINDLTQPPDRIPDGATITAIDTVANTVTISAQVQGNATGHALLVTSVSGSTPGGSSDPYYSPSYLTSTLQDPGQGGYAGSVNGRAGAVVLIW